MMTAEPAELLNGRTFAIISHPDAGKTTLTEKLLLFGGAIREAGAVKARRAQQHARSDWMAIEQERGISVTSTVLQFQYDGFRVNLLDTPGHQDFSEDTYRTLMAADSVVMVLDGAKGVEEQTLKLYQVCHRRAMPVVTFVNKLDREARSPWEILEDIEQKLGMRTYPMNWPVGMGAIFRGLYDRTEGVFELFDREARQFRRLPLDEAGLTEDESAALEEDLLLLTEAGESWDEAAFQRGELTAVYFGSAMANFGVETFLRGFLRLAPGPRPRPVEQGWVDPTAENFSGFVFKIQANMNPNHRDRVAFIRVCSGVFDRNLEVFHRQSGRRLRLSAPQQFLAQDRNIVDRAYPGDIIGVHDPGIFHIGDTVTTEPRWEFIGFPRFSPEHFAEVELQYTLKHKQYQRGLDQLVQEGVLQRFRPDDQGPQVYLGVVGPLQFEVFQYRMHHEYGVDVRLRSLPYRIARWVLAEPSRWEFGRFDRVKLVRDDLGRPVLLLEDERHLERVLERHPGLKVTDSAPLSAALDVG
ncbi:peptide chain release factor 3 [Sulfobacillus acidophilus TPY]|uniref:Peptide chain release factor 3 n=1 Tax=Sulfobacillus acidophilus (strain ATCC 700253 / DSM 10332 / NAL) TaxID=679936 RepID=G8TS80_SULAD|nr:peptide chain release factor 3 [Sulfobacillus acidophilus TPY]AEW05492.1 peptide chain release factor 3 [Sulfobacillus acidophilus DSM 10332]